MSTKLLLLFTILTFGAFAQEIPPKPNPPRLVNDFVGGLLSTEQVNALERKLVAYNDSTSTQIVVVIVKTTEPYETSEYAYKLGREWGVGQKDFNNGIVLLWAPGTRKVFIATGYGMEGAIPDITAKKIITHVIAPNFKELRYYEGLDKATDEIIKYASGEYKADPKGEDDGGISGFLFLLVILIVIFFIIRRNNRGGGGGIGRSIESGLPYTIFTGWGHQSGNWGGGGGGWSGGGGGGGGFGGFGGGGFGGGGAGGDY